MRQAIENLRRKQAARRARRDRERFYAAAAPWLCMALVSVAAIPAIVVFGLAASEMSLRVAGL